MAITKMKRIQLIALAKDRDELLSSLLHVGCVELREPEGELSGEDNAALLVPPFRGGGFRLFQFGGGGFRGRVLAFLQQGASIPLGFSSQLLGASSGVGSGLVHAFLHRAYLGYGFQ